MGSVQTTLDGLFNEIERQYVVTVAIGILWQKMCYTCPFKILFRLYNNIGAVSFEDLSSNLTVTKNSIDTLDLI